MYTVQPCSVCMTRRAASPLPAKRMKQTWYSLPSQGFPVQSLHGFMFYSIFMLEPNNCRLPVENSLTPWSTEAVIYSNWSSMGKIPFKISASSLLEPLDIWSRDSFWGSFQASKSNRNTYTGKSKETPRVACDEVEFRANLEGIEGEWSGAINNPALMNHVFSNLGESWVLESLSFCYLPGKTLNLWKAFRMRQYT